MYQYFVYRDISIDCNSANDKIVNNILNSKFDPGQYVKRVNFKTLRKPDNSQHMDSSDDRLYLLMKKCPHVQHVTLKQYTSSRTENPFSFEYFSKMLIFSGVRELHSLPKIMALSRRGHLLYNSVDYVNCAFHLKDTLVELCIGDIYMMGRNNGGFAYLKDFEMLKNLEIVDLINDIEGVNTLLTRYLPDRVNYLTIKLSSQSRESGQDISAEARNSNLMVTSGSPRSNLEMVELKNYVPTDDNEVSYISNQFAGLEFLRVDGGQYATPTWPAGTKISNHMMISLFKFLHGLPSYNFSCNVDNSGQLLQTYCKAQKTSSISARQNCSMEIFVQEDNLFYCVSDLKENSVSHLQYRCLGRSYKQTIGFTQILCN